VNRKCDAVIVNYNVAMLRQGGDLFGHFCALDLSSYNKDKDEILLLDTWKESNVIKPYFESVAKLWTAMATVDDESKLNRGFICITMTKKK